MSKNILAFGASSSRQSINKAFATFAAHQVADTEVTLLDLNDFEMPIYSIDKEKEQGIPALAQQFKQHIREADGIVISFAEHNSSYTAAFKNIYDWISRIEKSVWLDKPLLLLSTSPGGRGGKTVLQAAIDRFTITSNCPIFSFSLPHFKTNFSPENGILDADLKAKFEQALASFEEALVGETSEVNAE
ncbi:MAG: NAD(P)H-dependent oxidoreductase [Bacteroidota bacterium]